MPNCSVLCCKKRSTTSNLTKDGVTFHVFPKDPILRDIWKSFCKNRKKQKYFPRRTSVICSEHFKTSDFEMLPNNRRRLVEGSKPSVIPDSICFEMFCIARGCKSRWSPGSDIIFHRFPKDLERKKQWLDSVPIKGKWYKKATLCSLHFSAEDYRSGGGGGRYLRQTACPRVTTADVQEETPSDVDEDTVSCRICNKEFVSEVALSNHARIEHIDVHLTGEEGLCNLLAKDTVTVEKPGHFAMHPLVTSPGPEEVQACRGCLDTGGGQVELRGEMEEVFGQLTDLQVQGGSLCSICLQLLRKFNGFRQRCRDINKVLSEIPVVTEEALKNVDRKHLKHNYSISELIDMVCDPCIPEKSDPLFEESPIYMDDDSKIELDNDEYESISDSDNELNEEFEMKHTKYHEGVNINGDIITVVDGAANKTIDYLEESDDNFIWLENNENLEEDDTEINTTTTKQTKKNRKTCFNEAKKPHLEDEKLKHRRSSVVSPDNVSMGTLKFKMFTSFGRLKKSFRLEEDPFELFEKIHKESVLLKSGKSDGEEKVSKSKIKGDKVREKRNIRKFLDLNDQYADLLGVDVDFVSLYSVQRAMDERRGQAPPAPSCGLCCKTYNHTHTYLRHLRSAHNKNHPIECSVCKYRLVSQQKLFAHLLRHARRFICRECGAAMFMNTAFMNQVKEHLQLHRGQRFSCELCGKKLVNKKAYDSHVMNMHSNQVNSVKCQLCDETFHQDSGVKVHMNKMHNQCRRNILGSQAYNAHRKESHGQLKNRRSMESGESVENSQKLKEKKKKKTEINPSHTCDYCGKNFRSAATLKYHQRLHTGEKPYECDHCSQRFHNKQPMQAHIMNKHMGEKFKRKPIIGRPHLCDICGNGFALRGNMIAHRRTVHLGLKRPKRDRSHRNKKKKVVA